MYGESLVIRKMGLVERWLYLKPMENSFSILRIRMCLGPVQAYAKQTCSREKHLVFQLVGVFGNFKKYK